jgi:hypothetical protein
VSGEMMELLKHPFVIALIALFGAAIIVPLVKKFYFDPRSRLRVVTVWRTRTCEVLKQAVREMRNLPNWDELADIVNGKGYTMLTITNTSKKKISGVSVFVSDVGFDVFCQIDDDGELIKVKRGKPNVVGDIQPGHSRVMHVWSLMDMTDSNFASIKNLLQVSADERDSVSVRFPMPSYIRTKHRAVGNPPKLVKLFFFSLTPILGCRRWAVGQDLKSFKIGLIVFGIKLTFGAYGLDGW